jgi:hypothetical protein
MCSRVNNQVVAAHHEAAHAIVGYVLNRDFIEIQIECEYPYRGLGWNGNAKHKNKPHPDVRAKIGVAGALAEIKLFVVEESKLVPDQYWTESLSQVRIHPDCISSIANALWHLGNDLDNNISGNDSTIHVKLFIGEEIKTCQGFLSGPEEDMAIVLENVNHLKQKLENIVKETQEILDVPNNWKAVLHLAKELLKQKQRTFHRKILSENITRAVIRSVMDDNPTLRNDYIA